MPKTLTPRLPSRRAARATGGTPPAVVDGLGDQRLVIDNVSWEQYVTINDAIVDRPGLRTVYCDGSLTLVTESRKHSWYSERLGELVKELARVLKIPREDAGTATFRRRVKKGGVEGDKTFYFGENARKMRGSRNIDLNTQPPPDLAIEVEVSNSANDAVVVWGRLRVLEVWRFDPIAMECSFWSRKSDGTDVEIDRSLDFPMLTPADVVEQMRLVDEMVSGDWYEGLDRWIRKVIVPRKRKGG